VPAPEHFHANLQRGSLLLNQNRPLEALPFIQAAIAADIDAPQAYAELARCYNAIPRDRAKSIAAIDRAIGLAPHSSYYFGLKGWYLVCLMRYRAAFDAAQKGLAINPNCIQSLNSLANAHTKLNQWKKAEAACLRILALDPHDAPGLNLLAQALRHQSRWKESRETVARLLANMPNNSFAHANAGYAALAAGDHLRANEHFLTSLRLDPHFDLARRGLLQSLRARIWLIRWNHRIFSILRRPPSARNLLTTFLVIFGCLALMVGIMAISSSYDSTAGFAWLGLLFLAGLFYIYLSALVALMGNFMLMFDPLGRHALTRQEKAKASIPAIAFALIVGALILAGAWLVAIGLLLFFALLALSIQFPLIKDRWQRHREKQSEP